MATYEDLTKEQLINNLIALNERIRELEKRVNENEKIYEELMRTKSMYHGLFEFAPDAIVVVNRNGHLVQFNAQAERLFGYGRGEIFGKPVEILMPEVFRQRHAEHRQGFFLKPRIRPMGTGLELYGKRKNGSEFPVDISLGPIGTEKEISVVAVIRDITGRKRLEEELRKSHEKLEVRVQEGTEELKVANEKLRSEINQCQKVETELKKSEGDLRQLSVELLNAQEKERKLVAGEIHDSIGSSLTAVKFKMESALTEVAGSSFEATSALQGVIPIIQEAIDEARRIQMNLRPSVLDDLGILAAVNWFCQQFKSTYSKILLKQKINIEEQEVPDSLKAIIFRILQEGLNNVAKHSGSNEVFLSLSKRDQAITLTIRDYGRGFDLSTLQSTDGTSRGLGIRNMKERAELSGGSFKIESTEGEGTTISASWPIKS